MSKKQAPTIRINRISDTRRTATEAFLELICHAQNLPTTVENQTISDYNECSATQAASREVK